MTNTQENWEKELLDLLELTREEGIDPDRFRSFICKIREEDREAVIKAIENHPFKTQNDYAEDMISDFRSELLGKFGHKDYNPPAEAGLGK